MTEKLGISSRAELEAEEPLADSAPAEGSAEPLARLRTSPTVASLALPLALLGLYLLAIAVTDSRIVDPDAPLHLLATFRFNVVLALLIAYADRESRVDLPALATDLAALRPHLELQPGAFEARTRAALTGRAKRWIGLLAGGAFGASVVIAAELLTHEGFWGWNWDLHAWCELALMILLFALAGRVAIASLQAMLLFKEFGRKVRVRLLATEPLRVFGRRGLRGSRFCFIGSALAVLLVVNADAPGVVVAVIGLALLFGSAALLVPCLGVHQRLRQAKHAELARVRQAVEQRSATLLDAGRSEPFDSELPALLVYEVRIRSVSEWPLDTLMLLRFTLFVLIPIGSWVGGAMVERMIDAILD